MVFSGSEGYPTRLHSQQAVIFSRSLRPYCTVNPRSITHRVYAERDSRRRCDEDLVRSRPPARRATEKPVLADIKPSSSYLYRSRQEQLGQSGDAYRFESEEGLPTEEISLEEERRRTRAAARDGLTKAAKVTAKAGHGFLKVALPVSKWAMQTGFAAAASAVGNARAKEKETRSKQTKS